MGGNVSKETQTDTVAAYTYYGFGCTRCCFPKRHFVAGAPKEDGCGTSCTSLTFAPPAASHAEALARLEDQLDKAARTASDYISWTSHVFFSQCDATAKRAAEALNDEWCSVQNETILHPAGLDCRANGEVFGFGRSRVTYLVIRVQELKNPSIGKPMQG